MFALLKKSAPLFMVQQFEWDNSGKRTYLRQIESHHR